MDSRKWTARVVRERGWQPQIRPAANLGAIVTCGEVPAARLRAWLRPDGDIVLWRDEQTPEHLLAALLPLAALVLAPGEAWALGTRLAVTGDPRLDAALEPGAAARARGYLGLGAPGERALVLVLPSADGVAFEKMGRAIVTLRADADVVVAPPSLRWLSGRRPVPDALYGPGVSVVVGRPTRAELLAAADLVIAESGMALFDALALGVPALGITTAAPLAPARAGSAAGGEPTCLCDPVAAAADAVEWVDEPLDLAAAALRILRNPRPTLERGMDAASHLCGTVDGQAAARVASALQAVRTGAVRASG